jgi:D-alanyl-lipoteichoic acid acyltransferase DltB (MBOAT superfamily)
MSIVSTCGVLFVFKYFDFFVGSLATVAHAVGLEFATPALRLVLPIGLSFHTFQSLSYVIEVYYRRQQSEPDLLKYATYVMFFPQLVAGPIERPQNLLHQFDEVHRYDHTQVVRGLERMACGFFKKLVIADRLALYVNDVYAAPTHFNGLQLGLATGFFAFQIYCDFSGYSDIAIGSAQVLGFRLVENFRTPYRSRSISEFWQRWHISLSTWLRDYLFLKLSFVFARRVDKWPVSTRHADVAAYAGATLATMLIAGLWHGANWTYVLWGGILGLYLIAGVITKPARNRLYRLLGLERQNPVRIVVSTGTTFLLTCVAWAVFRAGSVGDAWYILTHVWTGWDFGVVKTEHFPLRQFPIAALALILLEALNWLHDHPSASLRVSQLPTIARWSIYAWVVFFVVLFGTYNNSRFIYFQF